MSQLPGAPGSWQADDNAATQITRMTTLNSDQNRHMEALTVVGELPGIATVPALATRLQISPATAYRWVRERKLIAWQSGEVIKGPLDQVLGPREPLPASAEIAAVMDLPPELVWDFLSNPWRWAGQPPETPLEKLKRGEVQAVLDAAPGYMSSMG